MTGRTDEPVAETTPPHAPAQLLPQGDADGTRLIGDAYALAREAHAGQWRDGGEPYLTHPVAVASILADHHQPPEVIAAALLHDVVEDTPVEIGEVGARFGAQVARLVDGVTKLETAYFADKHQAEVANYRRLIDALRRDPRVLLVKVADRLHNLRTLGAVSAARRRATCRATLSVYAPLAYRLSAHRFYRELEDAAAWWLWPRQMAAIRREATALRAQRHEALSGLCAQLSAVLGAEAAIRPKHEASLLAKSRARGIPLARLADLDAIEMVSDGDPAAGLRALEGLLGPASAVRDYVHRPRANGYRAVHATFAAPAGAVAVHLLTPAQREAAEFGVGAPGAAGVGLDFLERAGAARGDDLLAALASEVHADHHPVGPGPDRAGLSAWNAAIAHA